MNWLRIDAATLGHPKIGRLARALDVSQEHALGIVVSLWLATASARESGMLDGWRPEDLAYLCRWTCDRYTPESVVRALVESGWLYETDTGLSVHEWIEYQGNVEKVRKDNALRQKNYREKHGLHFKESVSNALVTCDSNATPLRSDGRDGRDGRDGADGADERDVTRNAPAAVAAPVAALPEHDLGPPVATFPCPCGQSWIATEAVALKLDAFYPELDIRTEIRDALAWVSAEPEKRAKPPDRMVQFLTGWLKRSAKRNGGSHVQA